MSNWGGANRPIVSNKLGVPNRSEGTDGDIQVRQTNLGAKLFGKIGGIWNSTFLSSESQIIGTGGTKIGMDSTGAFSVDQILLTGKITLTSTGSQNVCIGTGNIDKGENNVSIGVDAGNSILGGAELNTSIGTRAGESITTGDSNISIGSLSGINISTGTSNTCIGSKAGTTCNGTFSTYIGFWSGASGSSVGNEVVLCGGTGSATTGNGSNTVTLGTGTSSMAIYIGEDQQGILKTTSIDLLERASDPTEPTEGHAVIWMSNGLGKGADGDVMIASQAGGNTYYNTLFDHSASSGNTW